MYISDKEKEKQLKKAQHTLLSQASPAYWLKANNILIRENDPFTLDRHEYQQDWFDCDFPVQVWKKGAQMGAPLALDTVIPTIDGFIPLEQIKINDIVFDELGNPCNVIYVSDIFYNKPCYKVNVATASKSRGQESIICSDDHLWTVYEKGNGYTQKKTYSTHDLYEKFYKKEWYAYNKISLEKAPILNLPNKNLPIHPIVLVLWLMYGETDYCLLAVPNEKIQFIKQLLTSIPISFKNSSVKYKTHQCLDLGEEFQFQVNRLHLMDLYPHIPPEYFRTSIQQKLDMIEALKLFSRLRTKHYGWYVYETNNYHLASGFSNIIQSLGILCQFFKSHFQGKSIEYEIKWRPGKGYNRRKVMSIKEVPSVPTKCIGVNSPSNLFCITREFIPTHNTQFAIFKTLHNMIYGRYKQDVLYLFPTDDGAGEFSKGRFNPVININSTIKPFVKDTDAAGLKAIGNCFLYLRGARPTKSIAGEKKSSAGLKSTPCDSITYDEYDEMEKEMIDLAKQRLLHSLLKEERYISTPSIPEFGIDKLYSQSDQRVWMIKCTHCSSSVKGAIAKPKETCLELEFPSILKRIDDDTVIRACKHCGKEIYPKDGHWVAQFPDRSKTLVGWWIAVLSSSFESPKRLLDEYEDEETNLQEFHNSKLGMAYIFKENQLTRNDVLARCSKDVMENSSKNVCSMGIDVGKLLHVIIGYRISSSSYKVIKICSVHDFNEVHDLIKKFNVKRVVIDKRPETRKVREFLAGEPGIMGYMADYKENMKGNAAWDIGNREVTVNRTEICDTTHDLFTIDGKLELPRATEEINNEFIPHITAMVKVISKNDPSKGILYRYVANGADHYFHAMNYFILASDQSKVVSKKAKSSTQTTQQKLGYPW